MVDTGAFDIDFDGTSNQRPVLLDHSILYKHITRTGQLQASMFRRAVYGDKLSDLAPRNAFYLDGTRNVDAALYKNIALPLTGSTLRVAFEVYNVFNHVQWSFPNNDIASATFGTVSSQINGPRILQGTVRVIY